jgi:hypothetical protein
MLFAGILLFAGTQYGFCQRHVTYKGVCINGNVEKVKKEMEKKGWKYFRQYNWLENTISTTDELPPDYIVTAVDILFSSKSQTVSAMFFYMTDENRDSVYNQLYKELVSTYHHHHSYTDGTTFFIVKNKKNKDVGLVLLKKQHENDVAVVVVDYKNHFKAIKEGGKYLEEFYLNLYTLSH